MNKISIHGIAIVCKHSIKNKDEQIIIKVNRKSRRDVTKRFLFLYNFI